MKILTLGELLIRYATPVGTRLKDTQQLAVNYGGAEVNVAVSLANFGFDVTMATVLPANPLGLGAKQHLAKYGIRTDQLVYSGQRLGAYFVETGVGNRPAQVTYDRQFSAMAELTKNPWELDQLFRGIDLFHVSGITPGISPAVAKIFVALVKAAKERQIKVSFDVNYRGKLWTQKEAKKVFQEIFPLVDYCSAGPLDAYYFMGIPKPADQTDLNYYYEAMSKLYPNIQLFYATERQVISASVNQLNGLLWVDHQLYRSADYRIDAIIDRIGGGDAYSAGIISGILSQKSPQASVDFATAATVLKHTVSGDCNEFSEQEVQNYLENGSGAIVR